MKIKSLSRDAAAGALSWLLTGTVVLLVMLFSAMIVRDYGRETTAARQTIEEKGSVLIRALESGTRVGMGMRMHHAQLQALLGSTPEWNTVYGLTGCTTEAEYNTLRTKLLGCNYVSSVSFTEDTTSMFGSLIGSLNYVVVLIIVCAAALAAVVLYNLISVNLAERKKELATIKVLGFYDKEVYRYIFREIELLSLIGSGVGLLLGVPLHRFIILTVEMDQLMFIRTIAPRSYLLAVALTMLFTFVVCFAMRRHVRHISMVESMKAPE